MLLTLFWTQQNTSPKGETDPFFSSHENPSWSEPRYYRTLRKLPAGPFILPRGRMRKKEEKERGESENLSRYTLALPMTLCLTCNQNNSNPVTVCISAKFLNFSHRQQALGMTGCLSDSSRICQSPSSEATGKFNASERGHSYTFPLHAQSSILAPHPGRGDEDLGCSGRNPGPVSTPLPSRSLHPSAFWAVVIARMEINYQVFLLKRNWGGGGVGRTTLPIVEKNTLKSNRLRKTRFQVPSDITQSIDNVRYSDPLQSVIENKIDIKCIQAHLNLAS